MRIDPVRSIAGPAGSLEVRLDLPAAEPRAVCVLAHAHPSYGGTMHTKAVYQAAKGLTAAGVAVLRFNFRGVGTSTGTFDDGAGERADFAAALDYAASRFPDLPLWAAGMSFGAWVATSVGAEDARVALLLGIAVAAAHYPYDEMRTSEKPVFLIHGEADTIAPIRDVRRLYGAMREPKELVVIEDADHVFDGKASLVAEAVEDLLGDYRGE